MTRHGQNLTQVEAKLLRITRCCTLTPDSRLPDGPILLPSAGLPCQHRADDLPTVHCQANIGCRATNKLRLRDNLDEIFSRCWG